MKNLYEAKVVFFDLENTPNKVYTWGKYEQNALACIKKSYLLSFAYKWQGKKRVHACCLADFPLFKKDVQNDYELVKKLWNVFDEADIIITHNGKAFDVKKANTYFIYHHLPPPSPYKVVDTKTIAKSIGLFYSNKLDDLGETLNEGRKLEHEGFPLWEKCMNGDRDAFKRMVKYNKQDVVLLEKIYLRLQPFVQNHPHLAVSHTIHICPNCGSNKTHKRGFSFTRKRMTQRYQCMKCHAWSTGESQAIVH
jgi:predicted RNA-binding Zn-ribbon protein involved in translation (DUF1610 family)